MRKKLRDEERTFLYRHRRLLLDLHRARFDTNPTYELLMALRQRLPCEVSSTVVRFLL